MRTGSVCTGYGGLDLAVHEVLGGELAWAADIDPGASAILAHRFPSVPNLGDISKADWSAVEPVDVLTAGFPCQDVSCAGGRAGLRKGNRTGVWAYVARAIDELRPALVVLENVRGLLSAGADSDLESCPWCVGEAGNEHPLRALGAVLGDLADLGYDARWTVASAADAGAPHRRERVFITARPAADAAGGLRRAIAGGVAGSEGPGREEASGGRVRAGHGSARDGGSPAGHDAVADAEHAAGPRLADASQRTADGRAPADGHRPGARQGVTPEDADRAAGRERRLAAPGQAPRGRSRADAGGSGGASAADADGGGRGPAEPQDAPRQSDPSGRAAADAASDGRYARRPEPAGIVGGPDAAIGSDGSCPSCGCGADFHDHGGFCAGPCGGNCTDPELGRPDGGWNSFEDDADRADVRAYALAHSAGIRHGDARETGERGIPAAAVASAPADADSDGLARRQERHSEPLGGKAGYEQRRVDPLRRVLDWGNYAPAIHRWEAVIGRPAPRPTEPGRTGERLSPRFVEWMMGLPEGWVTDVPGLSRNAQLKALGNGVVPQQAAMAVRLLLERSGLLPLVAADATLSETRGAA